MWKRERMMVDVISLQNKQPINTILSHTTNTNSNTTILLQNRTCGYPFGGGKIHDDKNNFYAGNEYNIYGDVTTCNNSNQQQKRKRPLPPAAAAVTTTTTYSTTKTATKRQKQEQEQIEQQQDAIKKSNYTFTSKPYDVMDNLMYYY
jgi:hypothetical protein